VSLAIPSAVPANSKPLRVLLVEDSPDDADLLILTLQRGGYDLTVHRVETAKEMSEALNSQRWDVVLSDYSLPTFSAPDALATLQREGQDLPFIIVSGTVGEEVAVTALRAGAHDFLIKGNLARLIPALERSLREVSERRERVRLEAQLRQAQKMEAVGRLAGGIAHDFNNILTTICGYSEMVLDQIGSDKPISADLIEIRKAADRAAKLTRQLLAFSRQQVLRVVDVDVNEAMRAMQGMLQRLIGEDVVVQLTLTDPLPPVRADPVQLEQVLMNLAANARDAMPTGGRFTIRTSAAEAGEAIALTGLPVPPGRYIRLTISDTGSGMDALTRERLFEPFFTTKELGKGTGLGLATVYGIVKQLDGFIWVESEPGLGSTFSVFFHASDSATAASRQLTPPLASAPLATEREVVLLVEDDPGVRTLVSRTLKRHGYRLLEATSGAEGLAVAGRHGAAIDLVLTDVVMPLMRGPEMVSRIRETRPDIKVLYMSGHAGKPMTADSVLEPSTHLLEKPFQAHQLLQAVREILDTGALSSPGPSRE
jgi:signal transduction histidine kinase